MEACSSGCCRLGRYDTMASLSAGMMASIAVDVELAVRRWLWLGWIYLLRWQYLVLSSVC